MLLASSLNVLDIGTTFTENATSASESTFSVFKLSSRDESSGYGQDNPILVKINKWRGNKNILVYIFCNKISRGGLFRIE